MVTEHSDSRHNPFPQTDAEVQKLIGDVIEQTYQNLPAQEKQKLDAAVRNLSRGVKNMGHRSALEVLAKTGAFLEGTEIPDTVEGLRAMVQKESAPQ